VAKRRQVVSIGPVSGTIWASENFLAEPRRRSWPGPPTKLERIAERSGIDGEEYRLLLADAIQARRREVGAAWERFDNLLDKHANGS
jgi:hypothetical protein